MTVSGEIVQSGFFLPVRPISSSAVLTASNVGGRGMIAEILFEVGLVP